MINRQQYKNLVFHDIFSYPLTEHELNSLAWQDELNVASDNIQYQTQDGFYFLPHRVENIKVRNDNFINSINKLRKAKRMIKWLRLLPSVKMIAVCNSLGYLNASAGSDIDLFIITAPKKIWLTRFWLQSFLKLLGLRPYDRGQKQDSFCLTFFLSQDNLNISNLQITNPDIYLTYWLVKLLPVYDPDNLYQDFLQANSWLKKYLPQVGQMELDNNWIVKRSYFKYFFTIFTFGIWEKFLKKIQLILLPHSLRQLANQDSRVVMTDKILKFHGVDDRREYYQKLWEEKCLLKELRFKN